MGRHLDRDGDGRADHAERITDEDLAEFEFCEDGPTKEDLAVLERRADS